MTTALLEAREVGKRFGGIVAVDKVSLSIAPLEVKCIIGANGAGKSSLFNILCGAVRTDTGALLFDGRDISRLPLHRFSRIGIARKFQIPSVFPSLTVAQNLAVGLPASVGGAAGRARVDEVLALTELQGLRETSASVLAHGQKQWLEIGMALMSQPRLLLLDEPTAGMTPEETQRTARLILQMAAHTAVVSIEHDMSFVRALACHTYVMHQGRLLVEGRFEDIERNPLVRDVYLGKA